MDMPLMCSCRNPLIRAIAVRMPRLASRTRLRKKYVSTIMNGSGESVARARSGCHARQENRQAKQLHEIVQHGDDTRGKKIVQCVHVRGRAGHQPADRTAVEEAHRQALQVFEDFLAQVVHRFLPDPLHDSHLRVLQAETREERAEVCQDEPQRCRSTAMFLGMECAAPGTMK